MATKCLGIVGVGLIGGSIGLAARRTKQFATLLGVGRDRASLDQARQFGCIDEATDLETAARRSDVIVFCTPVDRIADLVVKAAPNCQPHALLTDAGSTKASIVAKIESAPSASIEFVGAHPLAGSEKQGCAFARADLFDARLTILTPIERTPAAAVKKAQQFWESLGCRIRIMPPDQHDKALSITSHLPHLLSALLASMLPQDLSDFTATGFRDMTRLASGDPALWTAIFVQNRDNVLAALGALHERLPKLEGALKSNDAQTIGQLLTHAKRIRDDLGD